MGVNSGKELYTTIAANARFGGKAVATRFTKGETNEVEQPLILAIQVNVFEFKKGHIGIVEKVQERSPDTGMLTELLLCTMNSGCVLETHPHHTHITW